ncbi:hypothetical protein OCHUTO_0582 [Orientia chuto str. Dubai]|uniref:Uncharacterized protein n=1 Tax=Orientia chuto str. Dubai TaxID=1359168 RepID=A0A0F3MKE7_9RICK|nr:hypothetical protein OCHUTO_0582 [Orientia chuto str. Dubai]
MIGMMRLNWQVKGTNNNERFNNILQTQGAQSIRNIVMPEVAKLTNQSNIQQPRLCPKI